MTCSISTGNSATAAIGLPVGLSEGDVIISHALDVHIEHIYQDWVESVSPVLRSLGYPKWGDLNERILASHCLAKGLS